MTRFKALDLAVEFYDRLSGVDAKGNLEDQLLRAGSSVALNLSEGNAKGSAKDKRHFFHVAYGSLRECQTNFRLLKIDGGSLLKMADALGACLYKLVNSQIKDSPNRR